MGILYIILFNTTCVCVCVEKMWICLWSHTLHFLGDPMYIPTVEQTVKQLRYKLDYWMIDMRRRYYGNLKNPRVINTKFKNEVLVSLRTHVKFPRSPKRDKFLRLRRSALADVESVINMYYDDDLLVAQDSAPPSRGCESFNLWDNFLEHPPEIVSMMSLGGSGCEETAAGRFGRSDSDPGAASSSDGMVDVDFLSAWLAESDTGATSLEERSTENPGKSEDVWAQTFAQAKAYFEPRRWVQNK